MQEVEYDKVSCRRGGFYPGVGHFRLQGIGLETLIAGERRRARERGARGDWIFLRTHPHHPRVFWAQRTLRWGSPTGIVPWT